MRLSEAIERLREAGVSSPEYDARELFLAFGELDGEYLSRATESSSPTLEKALLRRINREPLQYIIGKVGFYREEYEVSRDVLIPRADTEHLVDYAVRHIPESESFIDLCTGSGCIAISTLKNTRGTSAVAVDVSAGALAMARRNAEANGVAERLNLKKLDLLTDELPDGEFFAVLSNPPYVTPSAYSELEPEIYREPEIAFLGGEDGLRFYRRIIPLAKKILKPQGFIAFEIGYDQGEALTSLARESGFAVEIIKDYSKNDRVAVLRPIENR